LNFLTHTHDRFTAFFRDYLGELMPEENPGTSSGLYGAKECNRGRQALHPH